LLGPIDPAEVRPALDGRLTIALASCRFAELVGRVAAEHGGPPVAVQLKIDTGMHRFGVAPADATALAATVCAQPSLMIDGVFTHFADADGPDETPTRRQAAIFESICARLKESGSLLGLRHAANSATALRWRCFDYEAVRIGVAMYGLPPDPARRLPDDLRPALRVVSRIARVSVLPAADGVSYGLTYRAAANETIGLVPIGYADGLPRALSNRGTMGVAGRRAPIRGRVCMDQTVIGLPAEIKASDGIPVEVMGGDGSDGPSLAEVASLTGTIAYEIAVGLSRRLPRVYLRNGRETAT
jgi:alanine racemase